MVEVFNINDLIYKVNAGITADNSSKGKARTYKEALDINFFNARIRKVFCKNTEACHIFIYFIGKL